MNWLDNWITKGTRRVARSTSRRDFLSRMGVALVGVGAVPLLPVARANAAEGTRAPNRRKKAIRLSASTGATARSTDICAAVAVARPAVRPAPSHRRSRGSAHAAIRSTRRTTSFRTTTAAARRRAVAVSAIATRAIGRSTSGEEQRHQLVSRYHEQHVPLLDRRWCLGLLLRIELRIPPLVAAALRAARRTVGGCAPDYVLNCMGCHAVDGGGTPPTIPALKIASATTCTFRTGATISCRCRARRTRRSTTAARGRDQLDRRRTSPARRGRRLRAVRADEVAKATVVRRRRSSMRATIELRDAIRGGLSDTHGRW